MKPSPRGWLHIPSFSNKDSVASRMCLLPDRLRLPCATNSSLVCTGFKRSDAVDFGKRMTSAMVWWLLGLREQRLYGQQLATHTDDAPMTDFIGHQ